MRVIPATAIAAASAVAFTGAVMVTNQLHNGEVPTHDRPSASAARTSFSGLAAATGDPRLASLRTAHPAKGDVVQASGPFDDRFTMSGLSFDGRTVRGSVKITSDVSDILEFEALAGFYDADGRLLGTAPATRHTAEGNGAHGHSGSPDEVEPFSIVVPAALHGRAVSAAVGVPVLVNE